MTKTKRIIAVTLALMTVLVIISSASLISARCDHVCDGDDCPICYQIAVCENTLKTLGYAVIAIIFAAFSGFIIITASELKNSPALVASLVSLKVKLSD